MDLCWCFYATQAKRKRNEASKEGLLLTHLFLCLKLLFWSSFGFNRFIINGKNRTEKSSATLLFLCPQLANETKRIGRYYQKWVKRFRIRLRDHLSCIPFQYTHKRLCTVLNDKKKSDAKQIIMQMSHDGYKQEKKFLSRRVTLMSCHSKNTQ